MKWHLVLVYIACDFSIMSSQFGFLLNYCKRFHDLFIAGDFNVVLQSNEKWAVNSRLCSKAYLFCDFINNLLLKDMSFKGHMPKWSL